MSDRPEDIISDEEVARVHGHANFGTMTPREVLADGVWKYSMGYSAGSTQLAILRRHGLVTHRKGIRRNAELTKKGKAYLRSLNPPMPDAWNTCPSPPAKAPTLASVLSDLAQRQEPLGVDFERAIDADREGHYES